MKLRSHPSPPQEVPRCLDPAGEQARADVYCNYSDFVEVDAGLGAQEPDCWCECFGVTSITSSVERSDDTFVTPNGDADLGRGGFNTEYQHATNLPFR